MVPIIFSSVIAISLLTSQIHGFPATLGKHIERHMLEDGEPSLVKRTIPFDAASQYISTTGDHAFVPPGPGDQRGPCPGLNAMANQ